MAEINKTVLRFFTLTDYEEEENWLREMARQGWKLHHMTIPVFYHFQAAEPEDVVYKIDFRQLRGEDEGAFLQMYRDYGWEYVQTVNDYCYFRKSAEEASDGDLEIFTEPADKLDMLKRILLAKYLPFLAIFLLIVIPNFFRSLSAVGVGGAGETVLLLVWAILLALYVFICTRVALGFLRLKKKYRGED